MAERQGKESGRWVNKPEVSWGVYDRGAGRKEEVILEKNGLREVIHEALSIKGAG